MDEDDGDPRDNWPPYRLRVASLRVEAVASQPITLPPNAGSALRGAFGHALRRVACLYRTRGTPCEDCDENRDAARQNRPTHCVYGYLFDTPRPPNTPLLEHQQSVPRPFVIRPTDARRVIPSGDVVAYDIQLFGLGVDCAGYVARAVPLVGERGLGLGPIPGQAEVRAIWEQAPFGDERRPLPADVDPAKLTLVGGWEEARRRAEGITGPGFALRFLSFTRLNRTVITASGRRTSVSVEVPDFPVVMHAVARRLRLLALFHGGEDPGEHLARLTVAADGVGRLSWNGNRYDWHRYSTRQQRAIVHEGFVGTAVYAGNARLFAPYLVYGEATHIGRSCTMGAGRYAVHPAALKT